MKLSEFFKGTVLVALSIFTILLAGCHDDSEENDIDPAPKSLLEGEWLEYADTPTSRGYSAVAFKGDATFLQDMEILSKNGKISYEHLSGDFFHDDEKSFTLQFLNDNGYRQTDVYEIMELTNTKLLTWMSSVSAGDEFHRIVATFQPMVGDAFRIQAFSEYGNVGSYLSTCPNVATVDADGNIKAIKRGRAFIIAQIGNEAVAARVEVTDPDNVIDDYTVWVNKKIPDFEKVYGTYCFQMVDSTGVPFTVYHVLDPMVHRLIVTHMQNKIYEIQAWFEDWVDMDIIERSLAEKYTYSHTENGKIYYTTRVGGHTLSIGLNKNLHGIAVSEM
ncbi:MAG: hypothetical protein K2O24_02880 [Muribaculaceae bacterium]|nr:hypothetical protein [Muribaculaceae bacterium]